ncbi:MAG TPA: 50S ribosomal protein L11 methyltransferase [Bacillus bacterium]|nr:50S ribosomal protein L11 methyltransferase [Bacillus sp. (in: firmicutes)]
MKWSEMSIHTTQEAVEAISNILHEAGAGGVAIEDPADLVKVREQKFGEIYDLNPADYPEEGVIIKAYLPVTSSFAEMVESIKAAINNLVEYGIDLGLNTIKIDEVNEEDWSTAWKQYYHPIKISERVTIVPTWEEYEPETSEEIIVELDPGMAFGTGTHPTTVMCIQALEKVMPNGAHVIDVGTGSGVLSIVAAKLGASKVDAYDLDEVAVNSAIENVELNKVQQIVTVKQNNLIENINAEADCIVANILAEIILLFVDDAAKKVKKGGLFITSGIINTKQEEVEKALVKAGFEIEEILQMEDWVAIIARNK